MAKTATRPASKDGINFKTVEALFAARFAEETQRLVDLGYPRPKAETLARGMSNAWDQIVQNPDGTFRVFEPKADDHLTATPAEVAAAQRAREARISAETAGTAVDRRPTWYPEPDSGPTVCRPTPGGAVQIVGSWERLIEAVEQSGDLHLRFPREYSSWRHAKARVSNPNDKKFQSHGDRGIGMSIAWRNSFAQFLKDMGRRPKGTTLERKDNNGGYNKANCVWGTLSRQNANRRGWAKPGAKS